MDVSIHARTRRATHVTLHQAKHIILFQSTHAHGVRLFKLGYFIYRDCFNPRTHTACDCHYHYHGVWWLMFQSTHAHGVRHIFICLKQSRLMFQSTHAHGVRLATQVFATDWYGFNPRTHTACDIKDIPYLSSYPVSIHARTRRATYQVP